MTGIAALGVLLALMPAYAVAADPTDLAFPFTAESGQTRSWHISESETAALGDRHEETARWSERLTMTFGRRLTDGFEAKLTVSAVAPEAGAPDSLDYVLARSVTDQPIDVIVDQAGFVREVRNWPGVKAEMVAALPALTDATSAGIIATGLDRLDAVRAGTAVARPLLLLSAAYGLSFKSDGSIADYPDWQGGSAYIFPGREVVTHLVGKKDTNVFAEWSLKTDPAVAAAHAGSEVLALLNAAAHEDAALAELARTASALLATSGLNLAEEAVLVFDVNNRLVTRFRHRLTITVGGFRKEQEMLIDLVE